MGGMKTAAMASAAKAETAKAGKVDLIFMKMMRPDSSVSLCIENGSLHGRFDHIIVSGRHG